MNSSKKKGRPFIYTYFKKRAKEQKKDNEGLNAFQLKLNNIGHFPTVYKTTDELVRHFKQQLDKLFVAGLLKTGEEGKAPSTRNISMGDKSVYVEKGGDISLNIQ